MVKLLTVPATKGRRLAFGAEAASTFAKGDFWDQIKENTPEFTPLTKNNASVIFCSVNTLPPSAHYTFLHIKLYLARGLVSPLFLAFRLSRSRKGLDIIFKLSLQLIAEKTKCWHHCINFVNHFLMKDFIHKLHEKKWPPPLSPAQVCVHAPPLKVSVLRVQSSSVDERHQNKWKRIPYIINIFDTHCIYKYNMNIRQYIAQTVIWHHICVPQPQTVYWWVWDTPFPVFPVYWAVPGFVGLYVCFP